MTGRQLAWGWVLAGAALLLVAGYAAILLAQHQQRTDTATPPPGDTIVQVQRVVDGDTFATATGGRVRILGLDAPEIYHQSNGTGQDECFGTEASAMLTTLIGGTEVSLAQDRAGLSSDAYQRALRYVTTADGRDVSQVMIAGGWARYYEEYPVDRSPIYREDQADARTQQLGGWAPTENGGCGW